MGGGRGVKNGEGEKVVKKLRVGLGRGKREEKEEGREGCKNWKG